MMDEATERNTGPSRNDHPAVLRDQWCLGCRRFVSLALRRDSKTGAYHYACIGVYGDGCGARVEAPD